MIPVPPVTAHLKYPERGELPWSEWAVYDAVGFEVCRGMDRLAAQTVAMWANEHERMRAALVGVATVGRGEVERLACVGLGESWWIPIECQVKDVLVDRKVKSYVVRDNQRTDSYKGLVFDDA